MHDDAVLYLLGTPIGNMEDASFRLVRVLSEVGALACEDTRVTRKILARYDIPAPPVLFSCHEHNEGRAAERIAGLLRDGVSVGLATDAGMPGVSDPGYLVVRRAVEEGFPVESVPGPSAVVTALAMSGLPSTSFTFLGFPPNKGGKRRTFLGREADSRHTLVLYESPHRIGKCLQDALDVLGDRQAAVCLELTKKFERVERGFLSELAERFSGGKAKGEICLVIAGNHPKFRRDHPGNGLEHDRDAGHSGRDEEE